MIKKSLNTFAFLLLFFSQGFAQSAKHVVLITIDGFRPDFYKEDKWGTVNLHQLVNEGSYADGVRGVFPTVTYPSHTTIMTGAMPLKHGIYYNTPFEPGGETGRWYWEYSFIKVPTLFTAVRQAGLKSGGISWPVTLDAPIDYNVPEIWALDNKEDPSTEMRKHTTPAGLFEILEAQATGKITAADMDADYMIRDENQARMAAYIIKTYKPAFVAVHLPCVDHAEHAQGRDGEQVRRAIAGADYSIGRILEAVKQAGIKDSTAIIVTGDHGFVDINTVISPNVWLLKNGLIAGKEPKSDWKARFHTSGAGAFLMLKDKNDQKTLAKMHEILDQLPSSRHKLFRIVERAELDKIGADPNAALALAPVQGVSMNTSVQGEDIKAGHGGTHGFFPDFKEIQTGFIASGSGIAKGTVVPVMGLEDIAPLVAKLLGLKFTAPDGVLYPGLLEAKKTNQVNYK